jgi:surface protein
MKKLLLLLAFLVSTTTYSQTPITDANFKTAISTCLSINPVDGMCINSEYGVMPDWDVDNVNDMSGTFLYAEAFNGDLSAWDVGNVTDMSRMFQYAGAFNGDLSAWDVGNVTDMSSMFYNKYQTSVFNGDLSAWDVGNVTNMSSMFESAVAFNGDLSAWDVGNVTNMTTMFGGNEAFNGDLSAWDVGNVTSLAGMFLYAEAFNGDLSAWDVGNVIYISNMFESAVAFNGDLSAWDVGNVNNMISMFESAEAFNGDLSAWDVGNVTNMSSMFNNSGLSTDNYDAILIGWSQQEVESDIELGAEGINYCIGEDARLSLIDNNGWTINDAGLDCSTVGIIDETKLNVSIYPNPVSNILNIEGSNNKLEAVVFDMLGKEVIQQNITDKIDISYLEKGVYFIKFSDGLKVSTHKIIKI